MLKHRTALARVPPGTHPSTPKAPLPLLRLVLVFAMQLLAGRHASEYRANMGVLRQPDLARVLYTFCQANLLQCSFLDINGNLVLCVHSLDTAGLTK